MKILHMLFYALSISFILFMAWFYVWERLIETATLAEPLRQVVLGFFLIAFSLQAARWLLYRVKGDLSWLIGPAYFSFGLLSHLFLATLTKDCLYYIWWLAAPGSFELHEAWVNSWVSYVIFFFCLALNLWGAQTAYEGPEVKRVSVDLRKDPKSEDVFRIVQISDLHVGPIIRKPYVENVVRLCNELEGDVVCVTGDLGDGDPRALEDDLRPLRQLKSRLGTFYSTGNHEYYWNVDRWVHAVKSVGFRVLFNEGVLLPAGARSVWLAGVPDISASKIRKDHVHDAEAAVRGAPPDAVKVLLAHQPKSCFEAVRVGFDLMLSGHTHGGQYAPFTWMVDWFNPYSKDLHRLHRMFVYVNVGTGFWGPPLRLGVVSEITLLEVKI